ncbi:MAG: pyruvate kinase [Candidatus Saccharibacteria bacterium]|nr:pyruvate kinase [Candidatus Saccharibacteria bacterium]
MIFKRTKILVTVGPATNSYEQIEELIANGANGIRLNFSHGSHSERDTQIKWIRDASSKLGKPVAILQDLQGPKIRLGNLQHDVEVNTGDELLLQYQGTHHDNVIPIQYNLVDKVQVGQPLFIFDGKIRTKVLEVFDQTVKVRVEAGGTLMSRKGLNLPDTDFGGDILTDKDMDDIDYGIHQDIDYVALSFVQKAEDISGLREILKTKGSTAKIIAKIETKSAIEDTELERIIKECDGVMAARGDLAVEAGAEVVPIVQRKIIGLARTYGKLSIVATQMMASMVDNPEPTRAEVSDVALAAILGADTVMLSDETANGDYPIEATQAMKKVIKYTQEQMPVTPVFYRDDARGKKDAISAAAVTLAQQLEVSAIIAQTKSGATAASIAAHRPSLPIISVTTVPRVAQQLALLYANKSFLVQDDSEAGLHLAQKLNEDRNYFGEGEHTIVLVSGQQVGVSGGTDTIQVRNLG